MTFNVATAMTKEIMYIDVNRVAINPNQPRQLFKKEQLEELAQSINQHGVLQPITVRYARGKYELISGERRLRACKIANIRYIPAILVNVDDKESALLSIIENLQRENLNYIEEAEGMNILLRQFDMTQEELSKQIGKKQSTIANKLRLLRLSPQVKLFLLSNNLTERHGRAILKITDEPTQLEILKKVVDQELTVRKTEMLVEKYLMTEEQKEDNKKELKIKRRIRDIRVFTNTISSAIDIMKESGIPTDYTMQETDKGYQIIIDVDYKF